jgi:hypothetical protein
MKMRVRDNLDNVGDRIYINCSDAEGDSISADRVSDNTVAIVTLSVHESRQQQGRGTALVECLLTHLPRNVTSVVIKGSNDAPSFWEKMKKCRGGRILDI